MLSQAFTRVAAVPGTESNGSFCKKRGTLATTGIHTCGKPVQATIPASRDISYMRIAIWRGPSPACSCRKQPPILQSVRPTSSVFPSARSSNLILRYTTSGASPRGQDALRLRSKAEIVYNCGRCGKRKIIIETEKRPQGFHRFSTAPFLHANCGLLLLRNRLRALEVLIGTRKFIDSKWIGGEEQPVGLDQNGIGGHPGARGGVGSILGADNSIRIQKD